MNAFSSSRLNRPTTSATAAAAAAGGRTQTNSQQQKNVKSSQQASSSSSSSSSSARIDSSISSRSSQKRKRRHDADALFAASSDEEESEEESDSDDDHPTTSAPSSSSSSFSTSASSSSAVAAAKGKAKAATAAAGGGDSSGGPRKKSRNAPEEMSSKKKVNAGLVVTALPNTNVEKKRRDPRFDPLCGTFDPLHFHAHYDWMNDAKSKEIGEWRAMLAAGKGQDGELLVEEEKEEIKRDIQRAQQQIQMATRTKSEKTLMQQWKHQERAAQKDGKKPFFLKKSEEKKLALAARFMDLKSKKGALAKFMVKKTKDIKNKDHKYMPREGREE